MSSFEKDLEEIAEIDKGFCTKYDAEKIYSQGVFGYLQEKCGNSQLEKGENEFAQHINQIRWAIKDKVSKKYKKFEQFYEEMAERLNTTAGTLYVKFARKPKDARLSTLILYQQLLNYLDSKKDIKSF